MKLHNIGIALSGGGIRATIFHLGLFKWLAENGLLEEVKRVSSVSGASLSVATVYKGNIIKNLIMDCQSYTKYRPNETTGGIFVSWRRKEELPTGGLTEKLSLFFHAKKQEVNAYGR